MTTRLSIATVVQSHWQWTLPSTRDLIAFNYLSKTAGSGAESSDSPGHMAGQALMHYLRNHATIKLALIGAVPRVPSTLLDSSTSLSESVARDYMDAVSKASKLVGEAVSYTIEASDKINLTVKFDPAKIDATTSAVAVLNNLFPGHRFTANLGSGDHAIYEASIFIDTN